ncbi:MAG: hypothetical protein U0228_14130 [Myxococcaceae bacterium]
MTTIKRTGSPAAPAVSAPKTETSAAPSKAASTAPAAATGWKPKTSATAPHLAPTTAPAALAMAGHGPFLITAGAVQLARASGDPAAQALLLHGLAKDRSGVLLHNDATRIERAHQLFDGMSVQQADAVRAAYIHKYGMDPEHHIKSDDLGQPLARLPREVETELLGALNGPQLKADAKTLDGLLKKAQAGQPLTRADRTEYFNLLPRQGLWDQPVRQGPTTGNLDAQERTLLAREFGAQSGGANLDAALKQIEAALPPADLTPKGPREKNIAAIASSHGAQWQELMGWAQKMTDAGYHVQIFTPEGRPVAVQRDSLAVSTHTSGFGAPPDLDPHGRTGVIAKELLGNAAPAAKFNPKDFGAVYLAGGLGFNEDVAVAMPQGRETKLTANPNIEQMMNGAIAERLPVIGLCHGPTLLAALSIDVNGQKEPLNKGIETASLPPFEGYVGLTGRKEIQFTYDVNTHRALEASGGETHVLKDIANMSRVVKQRRDGMDIITGPGPQAAANLADATVEALHRKWD